MNNFFIILYLLSLNYFAIAQEDINLSINNITLTIKPHICVASRNMSNCISTIDVSWESDTPGNYCLITDFIDGRLRCWQNKTSGFFQHKLIFNKNIIYFINDNVTEVVLATAVMKYKSLKPHRKYKKRRNRFPWSITSP